jgi:mannosyltransferase OCH1-like enzyme
VIPRVFHQIWLGLEALPETHARYQETWLAHHPGWELRMWTEANVPRDLRRPEGLERIRPPWERSDLLRLELIWRFGGVYVDTDMECLRPLEPLIGKARFFSARSGRGRPHHALFGSVAGHPLLDSAINALVPSEFYGGKPSNLAPFGEMLNANRDEVLFLEPAIHRSKDTNRQLAYAVHHRDAIWKADPVFLRRFREVKEKAHRWRARYEEAAEQSNLWRARFEQAEAELDRLHERSQSTS